MTVALTLAGSLEFNPTKDSIKCPDVSELKLPFGDGLPVRGFDPSEDTYQGPPEDGSSVVDDVYPQLGQTPAFVSIWQVDWNRSDGHKNSDEGQGKMYN